MDENKGQPSCNPRENSEYTAFISNRIKMLRPRLLDLTKRNPLISTSLGERSNSLIRIVDEVPRNLLNRLSSGKMRLISLPDLDTDPKDESNKDFQNLLAAARINDEIYLSELEKIGQESEETPDLLEQAERQLKDRLRERLEMPQRQTKSSLSIKELQQHAKNHGISPHYDLPFEDNHSHLNEDQNIQTLMLPDILESRLNALVAKERTWKEESGISVLHAAFGFLEWEDKNNNSSQFSPLILLPVQLQKRRTKYGQEFWIEGEEAEAEVNEVLSEKLKLEFNITLPRYNGQDLEAYFEEVSQQQPKNMLWKLRRWVTIGVFPSARLAMYHDLDILDADIASHSIISSLFGGSVAGHDLLPFSEEYDTDAPDIEEKVPCLIADADSSQFSTIVDVANGKNLAVEGPPGTGKSQTIINTIASSLACGKKVLFVAEKSAALEVVRVRLEAFGLGDFLLPLQVSRSGKEQVIASIKSRMEMSRCDNPTELDGIIEERKKTRDQLKSYIDILSLTYEETDFTVHYILGQAIKLSHLIQNLPENVKKACAPDSTRLSQNKRQEILNQVHQVEKVLLDTRNHPEHWKCIQVADLTPFDIRELLDLASQAAKLFSKSEASRERLMGFHFKPETEKEELQKVKKIIKSTPNSLSDLQISITRNLQSLEIIETVKKYLKATSSWRSERDQLMIHMKDELNSLNLEKLSILKNLLIKHELDSLNDTAWQALLTKRKKLFEEIQDVEKIYDQSLQVCDAFSILLVGDLFKALSMLASLPLESLEVRNRKLDDASLQDLFNSYTKEAQALRDERQNLCENFFLSSLPASETIAQYGTSLFSSRMFFFFSREYRQAKKFYQSISKQKFDKSSAPRELRTLSEWVKSLNIFSKNEVFKDILGVHFKGIETNFTCYEHVISFFRKINKHFQGPNYAELREFLKYGDAEKIKSLPACKNNPYCDLSDWSLIRIKNEVDSFGKQIKELENDFVQIKELREILKNPQKVSKSTLIDLFIQYEQLLKTRSVLRENDQLKNILGIKFEAENTIKKDIEASYQLAVDLINLQPSNREAFLYSIKKPLCELDQLICEILEKERNALSLIERLSKKTMTEPEIWTKDKSLSKLSAFMELASKDTEGLRLYSRFVGEKNNLEQLGCRGLVEAILENGSSNLYENVEARLVYDMAEKIYKIHGKTLMGHCGASLDLLRKRFQEADREIIKLSRQKLQAQLYDKAAPPKGNSLGKKSSYTELALLKNEIAKKQRYTPVRTLTEKAAKALLELKPCWMMSPLAIAQYCPKGSIEFDLVIIDEASQMPPEDAIGALLRAKQCMIVGDTNQLPPTSFFRKVLEDEYADEDAQTTEESILEMANARFTPARRLRWHYRSRHSSLISFSNKHIYDDNLIVFPSAQEGANCGSVSYKHTRGIYSSGVNAEEAKVMVDEIVRFMKEHEDKSLGVVLLNQKQKNLLADEMNCVSNKEAHVRDYIEKWEQEKGGIEPFFLKNLENVQGDERDVIFIGTVYGPEKESGRVMQRFGPINGIAGKRRLNVLFSRAKEQIVTFSSMTAADIIADEEKNPGTYMLRCWLEYAASGLLYNGNSTAKEPESPFEEHVIQQVNSMGCQAVPQVGVKGYSIDIGVKHHQWPHGFIMGIECDGASYHSSPCARDRDRLRQEVLEGLGWHLYRIWSTDWFEDPQREIEKLRKAIAERLGMLKENSI